jgi:dienelactone hydrolase
MKTITIFLIMFFCFGLAFGQDITGTWNGVLKVQGMQLRIVFHIDKTDNGYKSTMDSPDQGAKGIPVNNTMLADNTVSLSITMAGIDYSGVLEGNNIKGTFKQGGMEIPLELTRGVVEKEPVKRSQDPTQPDPYHSEEVNFRNEGAYITLAGTLTLPKKDGVFPVVVLISGSGPQNRNEEVFNHRPFLVLSDHLTRNGIAVLRFDDRGVGESEGDFSKATSADFAMDVMSAVAYLETRKEINKKKIGLIGHSEGGLIAPMVATQSKDIGFIVLLAGPGIRGDKLLYEQSRLIAAASGIPDDLIERTSKTNSTI